MPGGGKVDLDVVDDHRVRRRIGRALDEDHTGQASRVEAAQRLRLELEQRDAHLDPFRLRNLLDESSHLDRHRETVRRIGQLDERQVRGADRLLRIAPEHQRIAKMLGSKISDIGPFNLRRPSAIRIRLPLQAQRIRRSVEDPGLHRQSAVYSADCACVRCLCARVEVLVWRQTVIEQNVRVVGGRLLRRRGLGRGT